MKIIIELLGSNSQKIWEASSWLLNQISIYSPDLLFDSEIFEDLLGYADKLWNSDKVSGGYMCNLIGKIAEANRVQYG